MDCLFRKSIFAFLTSSAVSGWYIQLNYHSH